MSVSDSIEGCALWWLETSGTLNRVSQEMERREGMAIPPAVLLINVPVDCTEIHNRNGKAKHKPLSIGLQIKNQKFYLLLLLA